MCVGRGVEAGKADSPPVSRTPRAGAQSSSAAEADAVRLKHIESRSTSFCSCALCGSQAKISAMERRVSLAPEPLVPPAGRGSQGLRSLALHPLEP